MTDISDIPNASILQQQLDTLFKSIDMLEMPGAAIPNMTVTPGPSNDPLVPFTLPISLQLDPPINNQSTLDKLIAALQIRATNISNQLVALGYQDDVTPTRATGYRPPS